MIRAVFGFWICLGMLGFTVPGGCMEKMAVVAWVNDGDTVLLADGRRVRYIGINAPEIDHKNQTAEPYAYEAKDYNKRLVYGGKIRLEFSSNRHDRYGRVLAYVFLPDGLFVNREMIAEGYAYFLPTGETGKYGADMLRAQRRAMAANLRIWSRLREGESDYIGNRRSKRFHAANCSSGKKIYKRNRKIFTNMRDAFYAGFAPHKSCVRAFGGRR